MATNMSDRQGAAYGGATTPGGAGNAGRDMSLSVQQAQRSAGTLAEKARSQIGAQLASQKDRASSTMSGVADALRQAGQTLQDNGASPVAGYVNGAADQVDRASQYLREKDVGELQAEAARLARERPVLVLAGAFALGFMGARFLKSSTPSRYAGSPDFDRPGDGQNRLSSSGSAYTSPTIGTGSYQPSAASASTAMPGAGYTGGGSGAGSSAAAATPPAIDDIRSGTYRE